MGGMKDEAKRMAIPPLFSRVHVDDTRKGGMSLCDKRSINVFDSPSTLSLLIPPPSNKSHLISRPEKHLEEKVNKNGMNCPSPRGSSITISTKQNEYHFKKLTNLDTQANTDLSLLSSNESRNESLSVMETHLNRRNLSNLRYETQKELKTVSPREQDISDCSAIDSVSGMGASSSDMARLIGEKRFWKMRAYMINQQKIFAAQVFELHRLIMVQKMIAKSPNLVLESKYNLGKRGTTRSSHLPEMEASKFKKPNNVTHKPANEEYPEHMKPKLPLPSLSKELVTPIWSQQLLTPPGNQWLVPLVSPSEGFIYKPYAGPCPPPSSALMVSMFGQDSLETEFRFPVAPQFNHHNYFTPRTTTVTNQFPSKASRVSRAIPFSLKKSQESNDSDEVDGSTASSPPEEKHKFGALLPLFPTEPTLQTDHNQHGAIKVVPHNPTSASESAARIFRYIQEERRDSIHMIS